MDRFTREENGAAVIDGAALSPAPGGGFSGPAARRLADFEAFYDDLLRSQELTLAEIGKRRGQNKTRSVIFQQLLSSKLLNAHILTLLKAHHL